VFGAMPCGSVLSMSVSTVAPVTLQRALPATYVMPAGIRSASRTAVAAWLPVFV
jgi:hypothetical protein